MFGHVESAEDVEKGAHLNHFLNVRTTNGFLSVKYWNMKNRDLFPVVGDLVELKMKDLEEAQAELDKWRSLSLDSKSGRSYFCDISILNEEDVPEDVRKKIKRDRTKQKIRALEIIKDDSYWKDKNLHSFLMNFFKKEMERFASVPAAIKNHHAYKSGLFIHTAHVFSLCQGVVNNPMKEFDEVDSDVLYMAAWFHDMGKMDVYSMDGEAPKMNFDKENMFGHIVLSDRIFRKAAEEAGLDSKFIDAVSHCILSHHQMREWNAVVEPVTNEAHILCRADGISSRISE
jgi:hypothetical protein